MRRPLRAVASGLMLLAGLAACSNQTDTDPGVSLLRGLSQVAVAKLGPKQAAAPAPTDLQVRQALQTAGTPIQRLQVQASGLVTYIAPVATNQGVATWSSNERLLVSMRDGVIVSTRGFGSDIMAATGPSTAELARGTGTHNRLYTYLDGADQTVKAPMTCTLSTVGSETITILGLQGPALHVLESCTGKLGTDTNDYWFRGGRLVQSRQFLVPGSPGLLLQAVID